MGFFSYRIGIFFFVGWEIRKKPPLIDMNYSRPCTCRPREFLFRKYLYHIYHTWYGIKCTWSRVIIFRYKFWSETVTTLTGNLWFWATWSRTRVRRIVRSILSRTRPACVRTTSPPRSTDSAWSRRTQRRNAGKYWGGQTSYRHIFSGRKLALSKFFGHIICNNLYQ